MDYLFKDVDNKTAKKKTESDIRLLRNAMCVCMYVHACLRVRACLDDVRACVCACVRAFVRVRARSYLS